MCTYSATSLIGCCPHARPACAACNATQAGLLLGCLGGGQRIQNNGQKISKKQREVHRQNKTNAEINNAHLRASLALKPHNFFFSLGVFMNELLDAALSMVWKFGIFIIAFAALIAFIKIKVAKLERRLADKRRRERRERKAKERRGE
jgi:hypothetical protein